MSQGWSPGTFLGPVNAPHASLLTDANASHIRVSLKDDNLGLGAKPGTSQSSGKCTGLDSFQGLLGRLNGKSESQLAKEQKSRNDIKRSIYAENRWGSSRFVKGGVLVGENILKLVQDRELENHLPSSASDLAVEGRSPSKPNHDNSQDNGTFPDSSVAHGPKTLECLRPSKSSFILPSTQPPCLRNPTLDERQDITTRCKKQKRGQGKVSALDQGDLELIALDRRRRKAEKTQRKLDRTKQREMKRASKVETQIIECHSKEAAVAEAEPEKSARLNSVDILNPPTPTPGLVGRNAVRKRYIEQKRMAKLDVKALNEVRLDPITRDI